VEAKDTEEKTLSVSGPVDLVVENDFGFVTVRPGTDGKVVVKTDKTGWGSSEADAQQALKDLKVVIEQDGDKIRVYLQRPADVDFINIGPGGAQANFTVTVPAETNVDLRSDNGELTLSGTQGTASLNTSFGDVTVKELTGGLSVTASNGRITAENINAEDAAISLSSDFGDITTDTIAGKDVTIKSTNGAMTLNQVEASGKLEARSDFGDLEIKAGTAGILDVHTSNGKVLVEDFNVSGPATVSSDFGDLTFVDVRTKGMDLKTQNGRVTINGAQGRIKAQSSFGDVEVSAEDAIVTLISDNGKVSFNGTLVDGEHTLQTDFGDINLTLPADIALNFDLKTDFGKIKSDLPVTISGDLDEKHWIGTINGGGLKLTVSTQNGNITIQTTK
jgi:DUF4097 and DUF4098 domain-containing protein YvlB